MTTNRPLPVDAIRPPKSKCSPFTGIHFEHREDKPNPFVMRWRHGGRRKFKAFASEIDRWRAAESMNAKREEHGRSVLTFDPAGWREYQDAKAIVGAADLRVICREWADRNGHRLRHVGILTSDAIEKYLKLRHAEDVRERTDTYRQLDMHLARRFSAAFGKERLADITADQIRAWLAALKDPDTGEPMAPVTLRNHRKNVLVFFKRAVEEGWIGTNVAAKVKPIQVDEEDGVVMPPEHVRALFEANRNEPVVGRLALEAFGGLRASSAGRIQREHLDFDAQGITMPGRVHKSGRRKYRQGHPDVLWEWLRAAPASCWTDITPAAYKNLKRFAWARARIPEYRNGLRHSFASYHLALFKDMARTGYLMQHARAATTEIYEGVAREAEAEAYFAVRPASG